MQLFNKILIPVNFSSLSEIAIKKAMDTALQCKSSELHLLSVVDSTATGYFITAETGMVLSLPSFSEFELSLKARMAELEKTIINNSALKVTTAVLTGNRIQLINDYVIKHDIDLVVIATENTSGFTEFIFGSDAQRITTQTICPVLTIQPYTLKRGMQKIILPVEDFYPESKLEYAIEMAQLFDAEIHLVCLSQKINLTVYGTYSIVKSIEEKLEEKKIRYKIKVVEGTNITTEILEYSKTESIDLILVNPGEESKLTGRVIETTGGHIVNHAAVPVLTVKKKSN